MLTQIFAVIELLLKLIGLWEDFAVYVDKKRTAEAEERKQKRDAAVDASKKADSDEDIWKSQEDITNNPP